MRPLHLVHLLIAVMTLFSARAAEEDRNYPLGPIGGQYHISSGEAYAKVVSLTSGAPGATGGLQVGDCILGAFGKPFTPTGSYHYGVSQDLGFAVDRAEGGDGALPLKVLRPGVGGLNITVNLPAAGAFGPAYPRNNAKAALLHESACAWLHAKAMSTNGSMGYFTGWTGLALLGHPDWNSTTGAKPYRLSINKVRDFCVSQITNGVYSPVEDKIINADGTQAANPNYQGGMSNWELGQMVMFLSEYYAKTRDLTDPGEIAATATVATALQRGAEICSNSIQWWKQPDISGTGYSPGYSQIAGIVSHGGVTGDYIHLGWGGGINICGVHSFNGMAFARSAGMNMASRPRDGHYFGYNPYPASLAPVVPAGMENYDHTIDEKFLIQMNWMANRCGGYSAGDPDDGHVCYTVQGWSAWDAGGRTPGTLLGMALYKRDGGTLSTADADRLERMKGYITRQYMKHQEAHAFCVGAQAYQAFSASFLSDRQQRFFMDNWRFYYALSRTPGNGFQYFRSRSINDSYLDETHCAALNAALPYGIAIGAYKLIPAYKSDRLLASFANPDILWPSLDARSLKVTTLNASIPFQITDGNGQTVDPSNYTATWTKLGGAGAVSFGTNTSYSDQTLAVYNQINPPDATNLPSGGQGNYRGFGIRFNDSALSVTGGVLSAPDTLLSSLTIRRSGSTGSGVTGNPSAAIVKVYSSQTPSTTTWIGDSTNTGNVSGGVSNGNVTFNFNNLPLQAGITYYFHFANTAGNLSSSAIVWTEGRLAVSNNSGHTYGSGNLVNASWGAADTAYDVVFASAIQSRTYSSPATNNDTITFPGDSTYRVRLTVTNGTYTLVEPIDVNVNTTPVTPPPSTMAFTAQPQAASAAMGGSVTLTVATNGPTPAFYQWRRNGVLIGSPSSSASFTLSNVSGGTEGNYDVIYTTSLGMLASETAHVTITGTGGNNAGGLWREVYTAIDGDSVASLTSNTKYPNFADSSGVIASAASASNYADSYGQRWTGWITPASTGNYRFYLASDDSSEVWLGTSDLPASAARILTLSGYIGEKQWSARAPSSWISLTAGVRYYIEIRHKEGAGGDHCAVAWQRQGDAAPVNGSGEIPGTYLSYRTGGIYNDISLENVAPAFASDPVLKPKAFDGTGYSGTLAGSAIDPNGGDVLSYSRLSGPAWLAVASNGTLSGTPATADLGINTLAVRVTDQAGLTDDAALQIEVAPANNPPVFAGNPHDGGSVLAGSVYVANLASFASDPDTVNGDTLTYSKISGPSWLAVAANGAVSGTPVMANFGPNSFVVRVTDAAGLFSDTTLDVNVTAPEMVKANNTTALNVTGSWVGGAVPGSGNVAVWNNSVNTANTVSLGANTTWTGLRIDNPGGDVTLNGAFTLAAGSVDTGNLRNLTFANAGDSSLSALAGSTVLTVNRAGSNNWTTTLNSTDALRFNGTLALRGGNASTSPASMSVHWLAFGGSSLTQKSGTAVALDTGASAGNAGDFVLADPWNGKTLQLSALSGFGSIRADWGTTSPVTRTVRVNQAVNTTFNGMFLAHTSRNLVLQKSGPGTLMMAGLIGAQSGTPRVDLAVEAGSLVLTANNARVNAADTTSISSGAILQVGNGGTTGTLGTTNGVTNNGTVVLNRGNTHTVANVISGSGQLRQIGTGTSVLSAANTYTGNTTITGGQLELTGSLAAASAVTVDAGGTLSGTGNAAGAVTISGMLAPGSSGAGTLTTGVLTLANGADLAWELGGSSGPHDLVNASSLGFTGSPTVQVHLTGTNPAASGQSLTIPLVSTIGGISGFADATFVIHAESLAGEVGAFAVHVQGNVLVLAIAPAGGTPTAWDTWQTLHFGGQAGNAAIAGPTADPDGDGVANRTEMALGLDPNDGNSRLKMALMEITSPGSVTLRISPAVIAGTYVIETADDPGGTWVAGSPVVIGTAAPSLDIPVQSSGSHKFFRLRYTPPDSL